jgi:hypothetical protein
LINIDQLLAKENNIAPIPNFISTESFHAQGILKHRSNNNYYYPTGMESKRKKGKVEVNKVSEKNEMNEANEANDANDANEVNEINKVN